MRFHGQIHISCFEHAIAEPSPGYQDNDVIDDSVVVKHYPGHWNGKTILAMWTEDVFHWKLVLLKCDIKNFEVSYTMQNRNSYNLSK